MADWHPPPWLAPEGWTPPVWDWGFPDDFDLNLAVQAHVVERNRVLRESLPASRSTPASMVPDTPLGRAYLQLPELARFIASTYEGATDPAQYVDGHGVDHRVASIELLARLIYRFICNYSFDEFARDPRGTVLRILNAPLFVWDEKIEPIRFEYRTLGLIPFPMQANGNAYNVPPTVGAYWLFQSNIRSTNLGLVSVDADLFDFIGYGETWSYDSARGFTFIEGMNTRLWHEGGGKLPPMWWPTLWRDYWWRIDNERERVSDRRFIFDTVRFIVSFFSLAGFVGAVNAVVSNGITFASGLRLAVSIDRLPGVDLGDASQVLSALSRVSSLRALFDGLTADAVAATSVPVIDEGPTMIFDYDANPWDPWAGEFDAGVGVDFDAGVGADFDLGTGIEFNLGADVPPIDSAIDFDLNSLVNRSDSIFGNIDVTALLTSIAALYVQHDLARRTIEQRGGTAPPATPRPGQTRTLSDGTTVRTNHDGSTTVRTPDGASRTVTPSGQIVAQAPAPTGAGIDQRTLLIGGAVAVAAILLLRRRG